MIPRQELADGGANAPKNTARRRKENAAAERREAPGRAIPAGISGDPEIGSTARRATGAAVRTSACRRSAPPHFFEGAEKETGAPGAPRETGRRSVGCARVIPGPSKARS